MTYQKNNSQEFLKELGINLEEKQTINKAISEFMDKRDLAKRVLKVQPFYFDNNKNWWYWNNKATCWRLTDETDILNTIGDLSNANTIKTQDRYEILEALRQEARKNKPKDIKPNWLQFKGEIFDIETGEQFPATPEYFAVNPLPYALNKNNLEETPTIDRIFKEWVGEEYSKTLYEIIAYCMVPNYPIHRLFCFIGEGLNGKSCYLNLLKKFVGIENIISTDLDKLLNSNFERTKLYKKLACEMGETNFNTISKTSILKQLTGQDLIGGEYKFKNAFDFENYAKILIATNNLPETTDKTIGFYRRWLIVDFKNKFSEKIDILKTIPEEEFESLALKCCSILADLLKKREFYKEGSIEDRQKRYEEKSNPMDKFLKEFCDTSEPDAYVFSWEFNQKFNEFCKDNRFREFNEHSIGDKLKGLGFEKGRKLIKTIYNEEKNYRVWYGLKFKDNKKTYKMGVLE